MQVSRGRFLRLFLLILVVAIAAILLVPRTVLTVRPNGTVNAKVITISAPIDGLLTRSTPDVGTPVSSGEIIAKIENRLEAQPLLAELDQQVNVARTLVDALSTKRKALIELRDRLLPQVDAFRVDSAISLRLQAVEAEARVRFWSAALNERGGALKRYRTLVSSGNVSKAAVDVAEAL